MNTLDEALQGAIDNKIPLVVSVPAYGLGITYAISQFANKNKIKTRITRGFKSKERLISDLSQLAWELKDDGGMVIVENFESLSISAAEDVRFFNEFIKASGYNVTIAFIVFSKNQEDPFSIVGNELLDVSLTFKFKGIGR